MHRPVAKDRPWIVHKRTFKYFFVHGCSHLGRPIHIVAYTQSGLISNDVKSH